VKNVLVAKTEKPFNSVNMWEYEWKGEEKPFRKLDDFKSLDVLNV
jgi:hypothetical protein